jgi:hypothetical protein
MICSSAFDIAGQQGVPLQPVKKPDKRYHNQNPAWPDYLPPLV